MSTSRTAAVAGATGLVGGHLLRQLLDDGAYQRVIAAVRRPPEQTHAKLEVRKIDFDALPEGSLAADDAYCALGTTIKAAGSKAAFRRVDFDYVLAFARAVRPAATQLVLVSALGASTSSSIFYNRTKGEIEAAVQELGFRGVHLFRPSFLEGERAERRLGEKVGSAAAKVLGLLPLGPLQRMRPIEASSVARAMICVARRGEPGVHVYESERIRAIAAES